VLRGLLAVVVLVAVVVIWLRLHRPGCPLLGIKVGNGSNGGRSAVDGSVQSLWEETTLAACAAQDGDVDHLQEQLCCVCVHGTPISTCESKTIGEQAADMNEISDQSSQDLCK